jgi:hypothetical protein
MRAAMDIDSIPGKLDALSERVGKIEVAMAENTELTRDIRDALVAGKVAGRFIKWVGGTVGGLAAMWAAWSQFGGGK